MCAVGLALGMTACGRRPPVAPPEVPVLVEVPDGQWPALADDMDVGSLAAACQESVAYLDALDPDRVLRFGSVDRTAAEMAAGVRRACAVLTTETDPEIRRRALARDLQMYRSSGRDGEGEVLVTGYFEPLLEARREPQPPFVYPVHGVPDDLLVVDWRGFGLADPGRRLRGRLAGRTVVPYADREGIEWEGGLPAETPVFGWVADRVELFFLHVQGSGTLEFVDGERIRVGYADTNGHPYESIGRLLIDEGAVPESDMSMQAIAAWLADHPDQVRRVMSANPSYVFFRPLDAAGGPLGCYGRPLVAGRSIATDRRLFPAPVVAWVRGHLPGPTDGDMAPLRRFVFNHDTGGAIRGPGRVDLYWGFGDEAGDRAGRTKHLGELYLLLPRRGPSG
jgi:membrane-bound lytic murein transglycosylase A